MVKSVCPYHSPCRVTSISGKVLEWEMIPVCHLSSQPSGLTCVHAHIQGIMLSCTPTCIYTLHASSLMENRVLARGYFIHQWLQYEG